jgi:hypothetical protein
MPVNVANEISAEDIALPRVKIGQFMSQAVQDQLVKPGAIFSSLGQDDAEPATLWKPGDKKGLLMHVLQLRKGWSLMQDGNLETWRFDDPTRPDDAWATYDYTVCLPEVDPDLPYKFLFTRTGRSAAQKINLQLKRAPQAHEIAFRVESLERSNDKGRFFVPRIVNEPADKKNVAAAADLLSMIAPAAAAPAAVSNEPAI